MYCEIYPRPTGPPGNNSRKADDIDDIFMKGRKDMKAKKLLSWLLVLAMVFTMIPLGSVVAHAVSLSGHEWVCCDTTKEHYVIAKITPSPKADIYCYDSHEWIKSESDQPMDKTKFADGNVAVGGIYVLEDGKYVECKLPTYTVTFDANGHGTAPDSYTDIEYEETILAPTEPTAEGYVFGGWYKESTCVTAWDFDSDEVTEDITLYAKWTTLTTLTVADFFNAITGKKCVDIVDAGAILCASGYDNVVEFFQNNSSTFENVKKVSDTVWTFDWLYETYTVNIYGEEHSFEEGTCTKCHIDQTFTKEDMLAGLNGKECIKLIDSTITIIASGYADVLAAIDELGELSCIMYSTDDGEYWAFCDEDEVNYVIYIYGEEHNMNGTECNVCGYKVTAAPKPLTFTAQDDSVTISLPYLPKKAAYQYSVDDGASWAAFTSEVTVNDGGSIQICMNPSVKAADVTYGKSVGNFLRFKTEGKGTLTASGDVMSLLAADTKNLPNYVFYRLFSSVANLTDASELKLPATTLAEACYAEMFKGCTGLTEAPELPATTLAKSCYNSMFYGCTALTAAPELPATTLAEACYQRMFYGCEALTKAPELPAMTLEYDCYRSMFQNCYKLTVVSALPATTLADDCYACMFMNCTALKTAFATLPATELTSNCYNGMFAGCTALTTAPALLATELAPSCYKQMFKNCEKLTATPELKATTMAENCYDGMFMGCKSLTKTTKLPATNLAKSCYFSMFADCIGLTTAPELPASNLIDSCYSSMFNGCTGIKVEKLADTSTETATWEFPASASASDWNTNMIKNVGKAILGEGETNVVLGGKYKVTAAIEPLTFTADGDVTISLAQTPAGASYEYVIDDGKWTPYTSAVTLTDGQSVMIRMDRTVDLSDVTYSESSTLRFKAEGDGTLVLSGNIMSLLPKGTKTMPGDHTFYYMFNNMKNLTDASELLLPATKLTESCYSGMFQNCKALTTAPTLPAEALAQDCYNCMFFGCENLTKAPELPATELTKSCYSNMFQNCKALTKAPALPATELTESCYNGMFQNCKALTTAPTLPAEALAQGCYNYMFYGCENLTKAPELPATELAVKCYTAMFRGCTSLTEAPELKSTKLANECYRELFYGCTSLTEAPELNAPTLAEGCYQNMFKGCTSLQAAPKLPATQMKKDCYNNMFRDCTSLTEVPELPATELAGSCYLSMFSGCTGIKLGTTETEDAWKIPVAETDASDWNKYMFNNCTGVDLGDGSKVPELNTTYYQILSINGWKEIQKVSKATSGTNVTIKDDDENELFTYSVDGESISITLKADLKAKKGCEAITIPTGKNVTIDLNGHAIDANGICGIFSVAKDATLTLNDSSNAKSGKLIGGVAYKGGAVENLGTFTMNGGTIENCEAIHKDGELADGNGGGVYNAGTFNMNGGTIDGCTAYCGGAGVFNEYVESVFNFNGGTIKNCTAANETMQDSCGGGIYNNMGKVIMDGGIIDGCSAQKNGGGVYNTGVFEMKSGEIKNCFTEESCGAGGGVYNAMNTVMNFYRTTFNMFGGKITGCSAQFGGAIANEGNADATCYVSIKGASQLTGNEAVDGGGAIYNLGEMKLNDTASITGNKAGGLGGGVYSDGKVTLCKSVKITDNKQGETKASNLYLDTNATLTLSGLTTGAEIGIGVKAADGIFVSSGATLELAGFFKADGDKFVLLSGDQLLLSDVNITGSDDKLVGDMDAVNAALDKISKIETAIDTLAGNFNGNGEGDATSESILNVLGSYGYVDVDLTGIKFEQKAENAVATTEITTFTFDVTPYTVIGETASEQHTLVSEVTFRLPLLATDYKYANIYHNGSFLKQVELSGTDEYIELSAKNFSEYSYMLTNTKYTVPTGGGSVSNSITAPASVDHGKVTIDKTKASSGEKVTITVTPDKGYTLETLTVKTSNGKEVELTKVNDTTYTFKMPSGKVTVEATFMEDNSMLNFFVDVPVSEYYYDAVLWAAENSITSGTDAIHFSPDMDTTRAQVVTFLWRAAGCPEPKAMTSFADVEVGSYYEKAVAWAIANGITKGTSDSTFSPDMICTRAHIAAFMARFAGVADANNSTVFTDVSENAYYASAVAWMLDNGVTEGTSDTTFSPDADCTRGQVVTFLYRYLAK